MEIVQFGFKVEPLFKYGFGFNTGINLQGYSRNLFENQLFNNGFEAYAVNIPVHLEYRFNFSKWFNIFAFGGAGINFYTESSFSEFTYPVSLDYGAGLRINRIQFTLGKSSLLGDFKDFNKIGQDIKPYKQLSTTLAYMF
ncbi:MAG: hypothetical protein IPL20_00120 [Saprospiraceae bacterium]|nr:hypothetical protein [Saprospiraceae bacterium]